MYGGIALNNNGGTIESCVNNCQIVVLYYASTVYGRNSMEVGSIAGHNNGIISDCINNANIKIIDHSSSNVNTFGIGGIVGVSGKGINLSEENSSKPQVIGCKNYGEIISDISTGLSGSYGGICGMATDLIKTSGNYNNITSDAGYIGGICGSVYLTHDNSVTYTGDGVQISLCTNKGSIFINSRASTHRFCGGVIGYTKFGDITIDNSYDLSGNYLIGSCYKYNGGNSDKGRDNKIEITSSYDLSNLDTSNKENNLSLGDYTTYSASRYRTLSYFNEYNILLWVGGLSSYYDKTKMEGQDYPALYWEKDEDIKNLN